jgi:hypothetical protein
VESFYAIAGFHGALQKPVAALLYRRLFRPAKSVASYRDIAAQLSMPPRTVSQLSGMPAFLFRTQKPQR